MAGCSGSGKTTLAAELATQLEATIFPLDLYYRDLSHLTPDTRDQLNFDHPDSLESELFIEHVRTLARRPSHPSAPSTTSRPTPASPEPSTPSHPPA